jgi:hypothetical protein
MSVFQELAAKRFPRSAQRRRIYGDGPFVLGIRCGGVPQVLLYPTQDGRQKKLQQLDRCGCGLGCTDDHDLFYLNGGVQ